VPVTSTSSSSATFAAPVPAGITLQFAVQNAINKTSIVKKTQSANNWTYDSVVAAATSARGVGYHTASGVSYESIFTDKVGTLMTQEYINAMTAGNTYVLFVTEPLADIVFEGEHYYVPCKSTQSVSAAKVQKFFEAKTEDAYTCFSLYAYLQIDEPVRVYAAADTGVFYASECVTLNVLRGTSLSSEPVQIPAGLNLENTVAFIKSALGLPGKSTDYKLQIKSASGGSFINVPATWKSDHAASSAVFQLVALP